jgi:hypothetical protein
MAGTPTGRGLETPDDPGRGRTPARDHPAGSGDLRQAAIPGNVAVDPAGAVPARRGAGGCSCPAVRALLSRAGHAE